MTEKTVNVYNNDPTELRCSKVISNCSCIKANGLQDGCERSKCRKNCEMAYSQMVPAEAFPNVKKHPEPARHRPVHHPEGANISNQKQDTNDNNRTQQSPRSQFTLQDQRNTRQYVSDGQNMQQDNAAIQRAQYEAVQNQGDLGQCHQHPPQEQMMYAPHEHYPAQQQIGQSDFGQPIKAYYVPQDQAMVQETQAQQFAAAMKAMQQPTAPHYAMQNQMPSTQYQQVAAQQYPAATMQMPQQTYGQAAPQTVTVQLPPQEQPQPQTIRVQIPQQVMQELRQQQEQNPAIGHQHNQFQQVAGQPQQQLQYQQATDQQQIPCQRHPYQQTGGQQQVAFHQVAAQQQVPFQQASGQQQVAFQQASGQQQVPFQQASGQQQVPFQQASVQQPASSLQQITGQQAGGQQAHFQQVQQQQQQIPLQQVNQTAIDDQGQQNIWGMNTQENMQMQHYNSIPQYEEQAVVMS